MATGNFNMTPDPALGEYSTSPYGSFGNPAIDMLMNVLMRNQQLAPRPLGNQSYMEASLLRQRSMDFMRMQGMGLVNNDVMTRAGFRPTENLATAAYMTNMMTGGMVSAAMNPFLGGNPVIAQQRLYAGLTGMTMTAFGQNGGNTSLATTNQLMNVMNENFYRKGGGIDYQRTMGMRLEDVAGTFVQAANYQLLGRQGVQGAFRGFTGGGGIGAVTAAQQLFGGSSTEAMGSLNQFLGAGSVNLSDTGQANQMENLLRRVKGMSKIAGVSIQAMLGIIQEGQQLMSAHPALKYVGGGAVAEIGIRAMAGATASVASMDPDLVRQLGGPQAIARSYQMGGAQALASPLMQQLGAMSFAYSGNTGVQGLIKNYLSTGDMTQATHARLIEQVAAAAGTNTAAVTIAANNSLFAQRGLADMTNDIKNPALAALVRSRGRNVDIQEMQRMVEGAGGNWGSFAKEVGATGDLVKAYALSGASGIDQQIDYAMQSGLADPMRRQLNPTYNAKVRESEKAATIYADLESKMDRKMGHMRAPVIENVIQSLMSGKFGSQSLGQTFTDMFGDDYARSSLGRLILSESEMATTGGIGKLQSAQGRAGMSTGAIEAITGLGMTAGEIFGLSEVDKKGVSGIDKKISALREQLNGASPKETEEIQKKINGLESKKSSVLTAGTALRGAGYDPASGNLVTKAYDRAGNLTVSTMSRTEQSLAFQTSILQSAEEAVNESTQGTAGAKLEEGILELGKSGKMGLRNREMISPKELYNRYKKMTSKEVEELQKTQSWSKIEPYIKLREHAEQIAQGKGAEALQSGSPQNQLLQGLGKFVDALGGEQMLTTLKNILAALEGASANG